MQWISLIHHKFYVVNMCFTVITCDALPVDNHGYYTNANCTSREQAYDDTCTLECHLGYKSNGDPMKTCQLDGTWNSSTRCIGKCHLNGTWKSSMRCIGKCHLNGTWNSSTRCIGKCQLDETWNLFIRCIGNCQLCYIFVGDQPGENVSRILKP